jgi:hypothetical protein
MHETNVIPVQVRACIFGLSFCYDVNTAKPTTDSSLLDTVKKHENLPPERDCGILSNQKTFEVNDSDESVMLWAFTFSASSKILA